MIDLVLDASVVLKWFKPPQGRHAEKRSVEALALREAYSSGRCQVAAPALLPLEILNVAGRSWGHDAAALAEMARDLKDLEFEMVEPAIQGVAAWVATGLTAYDAAYVALAEDRGIPLVTDDREILRVAPDVARPLAGFRL